MLNTNRESKITINASIYSVYFKSSSKQSKYWLVLSHVSYQERFRLGLPWLPHNTDEEFLESQFDCRIGRQRNWGNESNWKGVGVWKTEQKWEWKKATPSSNTPRCVCLSHWRNPGKFRQLPSTKGMESQERWEWWLPSNIWVIHSHVLIRGA